MRIYVSNSQHFSKRNRKLVSVKHRLLTTEFILGVESGQQTGDSN